MLRALGLGDLLTAVPALRGLRAALPGHHLVLAAPAGLAPLVNLAGCVDGIVAVNELSAVPWTGCAPDVAVNLHGSGPQSHRLLQQLHPRELVAYACSEAAVDGPAWRPHEHEVHRWTRLVHDAFAPPVDPEALDLRRPGVPSPAPGAVVVHPGAAYGAKRWPAERFAAVAAALQAQGHRVVVTGSAAESTITGQVVAQAGLPATADLAGRLELLELAALVAGARLVLVNDTGVAHLATAYRTPSVVVFGPADPARWAPPARRLQHVVLWRGHAGQGEQDRFGAHPGAALLAISVDDVLAAAERAPVGVVPARLG